MVNMERRKRALDIHSQQPCDWCQRRQLCQTPEESMRTMARLARGNKTRIFMDGALFDKGRVDKAKRITVFVDPSGSTKRIKVGDTFLTEQGRYGVDRFTGTEK